MKQTWVDGNVANPVSAARMGVIENGIFDAHFQPAARVFHNANQSITSGVHTALAFNSERFDTDTIHDTVTNNTRLTCKTAGKYLICGGFQFAASAAGGLRETRIVLNGATLIAIGDAAPNASPISLFITTIYDLAVNDYVEQTAYQDSGGALNVLTGGNYSPEFSMVRVA